MVTCTGCLLSLSPSSSQPTCSHSHCCWWGTSLLGTSHPSCLYSPRVFISLMSELHMHSCTCTDLEGWGAWQPRVNDVPLPGINEGREPVDTWELPLFPQTVLRSITQLFRVLWVDTLPVTHSGDPLTFLPSVLVFMFPIPISWFFFPHYTICT